MPVAGVVTAEAVLRLAPKIKTVERIKDSAFLLKDNDVFDVTMTDNIDVLNTSYSLNLFPVFYTYTGTTQPSCIGIPPVLDLINLQYNQNGTNITYGNSIF